MKPQKRRSPIGDLDFNAVFPHREMTANQREAFRLITKWEGRVTLELPTGTGKTAIGYTFLRALAQKDQGPLFYICPTRTLVDQVFRLHLDLTPVYGRHEYDCLYYPDRALKADQIPTVLCPGCDHFVDQETGATNVPGVTPCPYYLAKYRAKRSSIVVCTMAFYLYHVLFRAGKEWEEPAGLVIDEAHDMAEAVRRCLTYDISDDHLYRAAELMSLINAQAAETLHRFRNKMVHIIKRRSRRPEVILSDAEIVDLLVILNDLDDRALAKELDQAIRRGVVNPSPDADLVAVKQLDTIINGLRRYVRSLEFCLETDQRHALNFAYATWREEMTERQRARYILTVGSYYVAPLIRKMLAPRTVSYSATIGKGDIFQEVTGINAPVEYLGSDFPHQHTRVFLPKDTRNLAYNERGRNDVNRSLRLIVKGCKRFAEAGHRSLVVVVSEKERKNFVTFSGEAGLDVISYGNGVPAKEAATRFRNGMSMVLVGTAAQFGQGLDLPEQTAPVIFFLRPGYPSPYDPESQFEARRFRKHVWKQRKWRVMIEALQVRGRNIRSMKDRGVTFFMSQQFGDFLYGSLPEWLQDAYKGNKSFEECVEETITLLK